MNFFSFLSKFTARGPRKRAAGRSPHEVTLTLEVLENRLVPASTNNAISGFVYYDANTDGLYNPGDTALANTQVSLYNANGVLVNTTTSNGIGYYQFTNDNTINPAPRTVTQTLNVPWQTTDFSVNQALQQFNPNDPNTLGTLTSVTIQFNSAISSDIKVENTSQTSPSVINGNVSGQITLTGPGGLNLVNQPNANAGSYDASVFDGFTDYSGTSGTDFGNKQANAANSVTLTGAAMNAFIGSGNLNFNVNTIATSHASGGGNVNASITSYSTSNVTVTYTYAPDTSLKQGNYTIVDTPPGHGFIDSWLSSNGSIIPGSFGTHTIYVQVTGNNFISTNNNFAELWPSSISGFVWADTGSGSDYNDGVREPEEMGLPNVTITLTGTTVGNTPVTKTTQTDGNGNYWFTNLTPGTYQVQETPPAGWQDGKDIIGTLSGTNPNHETLNNIQLPNSTNAVNYDFGELKPVGTLSGYVYADTSTTGYNDGIKEGGEAGIANVLMGLTYTNPTTGQAASLTTTTDANGYYQFTGLAPGTYSIWESQPAGWIQGKVTQGTPGTGTPSPGVILNIQLATSVNGINNNFAELTPNNNNDAGSSLSGYVYADISSTGYNDGIKEGGEAGIANVLMGLTYTNPTTGQAASLTTTTDANGFYQFTNLAPGTYSIWESQPSGWLQGKVTQGTPGTGTPFPGVILNVQLADDVNGVNNNFGELTPNNNGGSGSSLSGYVYADISSTGYNNGIKETGEAGITNTLIGLTYTNPTTGQAMSLNTTTDANGFYQFTNLAPGTYSIWEAQPSGWLQGKDMQGTPGTGTTYPGVFLNVQLAANVNGVNNNFGELQPVVKSTQGNVPVPLTPPPISLNPQFVPVDFFGKSQLLTTPGNSYQNTALQTEGTWVDGMYRTLFDRPATYQELGYWVNQLIAGTSRQQIVTALWYSPQHLTIEVGTFYQTYLGRSASAAETSYWVNLLLQTHNETQMAQLILSSPEYLSRIGGGTNFIAAMYATVLDTDQIPATDLANWQNLLTSSGNNYGLVALDFLNSLSSETLVTQTFFQQVLGRAPSAAELSLWVNQMQTNQEPLFGLGITLLASNELYNIAAQKA